MNGPRTSREAMVAELLGEIDTLLSRVETLPSVVAGAEERVAQAAAALTDAGDQYRLAVTAFTDEAKTDLTQYLERKAGAIASATAEEQRVAMQSAARHAFESESFDKAERLLVVLRTAVNEFDRSMRSRRVDHALTALIASCFTAILVYAIVRGC